MFLGPHHLIPTVTEQHRLICDLSGTAAAGVRTGLLRAGTAAAGVRTGLLRAGTAYAALIGWLHQDTGTSRSRPTGGRSPSTWRTAAATLT